MTGFTVRFTVVIQSAWYTVCRTNEEVYNGHGSSHHSHQFPTQPMTNFERGLVNGLIMSAMVWALLLWLIL